MQKYQPITGTSLRGPEGTAFTDEEREQLGVVGPLLDAVEDNDQQLEWARGQFWGKIANVFETHALFYRSGICLAYFLSNQHESAGGRILGDGSPKQCGELRRADGRRLAAGRRVGLRL